MAADVLSAWLLSLMLATVAPGNSRRPPEARESAEQGKARYAAIADTIAKVSLDAEETPLFAGPRARPKTALLLLTISLHESHWRRNVDLGLGPLSLRGGGRYHCMMQIAVPGDKTPEGWTAADLVKSRERCFRRALHILQRGKKACDKKGPRAFLNQYGSGTCTGGKKAVDKRWKTFDRLLTQHPPKEQPN
jgi:hypothetical protein